MKTWQVFAVCFGFFVMVMIYAVWVEPNWLQINHFRFVGSVKTPVKIAHLSDLHIRENHRLERKILTNLSKEKPDVIFITGDTLSDSGNVSAARDFVSQLHAPLGVFAVKGNWENWEAQEMERSLSSAPGLVWLDNKNFRLRDDVWVVGFDDSMAGNPDINSALLGLPQDVFCILLFHSPEFISAVDGNCALALSGHTHGGQMRLPLLAPLWLPAGSGKFISGWYDSNGTKMYVSRGIGTSLIAARLLSRPEIAYIVIDKVVAP